MNHFLKIEKLEGDLTLYSITGILGLMALVSNAAMGILLKEELRDSPSPQDDMKVILQVLHFFGSMSVMGISCCLFEETEKKLKKLRGKS